jgi:hypothetical protein
MLTHLSMQKAPKLRKQMPHAFTNEERIREYLADRARYAEPQRYNDRAWNFPRTPYGSQSAATQAPSLNAAGCLLFDGVMK